MSSTATHRPGHRTPAVAGATDPTWTAEASSGERTPVAVWCLLAGLACNIFSGYSGELHLPIGPDRLLLPAAVLLAVLTPWPRPFRWRTVHTAMLALAAIATWSAWTVGTLTDPRGMFALLDRILVPFVLFAVAPALLDRPLWRRRLLQTLTLVGAYLVVVTLLETFHVTGAIWPRYIVEVQAAKVASDPTVVPRAGGPFTSGEANGMALAMCGFAAATLAATARGASRVAGAVVAPLCLLCTIFTMTRSAWLGAALGIVGVVWATRALWRWIPALVVAGVGLAAVGAAAFPEIVEGIVERGGTANSLWDRQNTNSAALRIMSERPLTGVGWSRFVDVGREWVRQADTYPLSNVNIEVHNVFLSRGAELGVPAMLLFVLCVAAGPVAALWRRRTGEAEAWRMLLLGCFAVWFVVCMTSPNPYPFPTLLMWTVAGYVFADARSGPRTRGTAPRTGAHAA